MFILKARKHVERIITPTLTSIFLGVITTLKLDSKYNYLASFTSQIIVYSLIYYLAYRAAKNIKTALDDHDKDSLALISTALKNSSQNSEAMMKANGDLDESYKEYQKSLVVEMNDITMDMIRKRKDSKRKMEKQQMEITAEMNDIQGKIKTQVDSIAEKIDEGNKKDGNEIQ